MQEILVSVGLVALFVVMLLGCVLAVIGGILHKDEPPEGRGRDLGG